MNGGPAPTDAVARSRSCSTVHIRSSQIAVRSSCTCATWQFGCLRCVAAASQYGRGRYGWMELPNALSVLLQWAAFAGHLCEGPALAQWRADLLSGRVWRSRARDKSVRAAVCVVLVKLDHRALRGVMHPRMQLCGPVLLPSAAGPNAIAPRSNLRRIRSGKSCTCVFTPSCRLQGFVLTPRCERLVKRASRIARMVTRYSSLPWCTVATDVRAICAKPPPHKFTGKLPRGRA
ncbi:hypothetical protein ABID25_005817 [Mesorhizobium abyssinicae]